MTHDPSAGRGAAEPGRGQHLGQWPAGVAGCRPAAGLSLESPRRTRRRTSRRRDAGRKQAHGGTRGLSRGPAAFLGWRVPAQRLGSGPGSAARSPALASPNVTVPTRGIGRREAQQTLLVDGSVLGPGQDGGTGSPACWLRHRVPARWRRKRENHTDGTFTKRRRCDKLAVTRCGVGGSHTPAPPACPRPPRLKHQRVSTSSSCTPSFPPQEPVSRPPLATRMCV